MKVQRIDNIKEQEFIDKYLLANVPVIVTDGMKDWKVDKFGPQQLDQAFGHYEVQIYDDLFELQTIDTLHSYLLDNFNKPAGNTHKPLYIRWYTKLKEVDFFWADEVFEKLSDSWAHPYFIPNDNLVIPYTPEGGTANVNEAYYPYRGLFISCKGARTRLHKDPFNSNAVLCQFYGEKEMLLYAPDQQPYVMNEHGFVDPKNPDLQKFPQFNKARPTYEDVLAPGEIVLFPAGWFHDVTCAGDSISITWNFVHHAEKEQLSEFIRLNPEDSQLEIVQFFLQGRKL
ncbi:Cupin-like domain-containing protein [Chitinophaga eiseniae]|uniref:Cupin-like domain-containing protein n=1 Tax=Chitinophaga eiseniae TaxID=634771 RepID=A0A1T4T5T9_9BACT|nr:cupin-like domain-containing protein [Chitinophaga eiseniae]SKA35806.1 Cupin-like domain-containing protein [Chitinophaga eiseniae]